MTVVQTHTIVGQTAARGLVGILLPIARQPLYYNRFVSDPLANLAEGGKRASVAVGAPAVVAGPPSYLPASGSVTGIVTPASMAGDCTLLVAARKPAQATGGFHVAPLISNYYTDAHGKWQGILLGHDTYNQTQDLPVLWAVETETGSSNQMGGEPITTAQGQAWNLHSVRLTGVGQKGYTAIISNHTTGTTKTITSDNTIPLLPATPNFAIGTTFVASNGGLVDHADILCAGIFDAALSDDDLQAVVDIERRWQSSINGVTL